MIFFLNANGKLPYLKEFEIIDEEEEYRIQRELQRDEEISRNFIMSEPNKLKWKFQFYL
jgi:hypothetical protein